jgi:hypothetical protein
MSLEFVLTKGDPWRYAVAGLVAGLAVGGLAAVPLTELSSSHILLAARWWVAAPLVATALYSPYYQAFRAHEEADPERSEKVNRMYRRTAVSAPPRTRSYAQMKSTTEGRVFANSTYATLISLTALLPIMIVGRTAGAVALGAATGLVLELGAATSRHAAGLPPSHPIAPLITVLKQRALLALQFFLFAGICVNFFSKPVDLWSMSILHQAANSTRWPFDALGIFIGFLAGLAIGYRLIAWDTIGFPISNAIARALLISKRRLPWRTFRYMKFVASSGIARTNRGRFALRHQLLTDHIIGASQSFSHGDP